MVKICEIVGTLEILEHGVVEMLEKLRQKKRSSR